MDHALGVVAAVVVVDVVADGVVAIPSCVAVVAAACVAVVA